MPPSSSSSAADAAVVSPASDRGVTAREENTDEVTELPPDGAKRDDPPVDGAKLKIEAGGGFAGVVENSPAAGVAGWKLNFGPSFFSVAGAPPNLIGVPTLKV